MKTFGAGIHVLVQKGNKYLILKRSADDEDDPGCWDLPGGGIDFGEQPTEAAIRESEEETGVKIAVQNIIGMYALGSDDFWPTSGIEFTWFQLFNRNILNF